MKYIRRYNESETFDVFTEEDFNWVKDSMIELEDQGFSIKKCTYSPFSMVLNIFSTNLTLGKYNYDAFSIMDLGEEFIGRLFGMMKDKHNSGRILINLDYRITTLFNIMDYDNLDFLFKDHKSDEQISEIEKMFPYLFATINVGKNTKEDIWKVIPRTCKIMQIKIRV